MIFDKENTFSDAQAITETCYSDYGVNLGEDSDLVPLDNEKNGDLVIQVVEDFDGLGSLYVIIQTASDDEFTYAINIATTDSLDLNQLRAGRNFRISNLPPAALQYLRLYYYVTGAKTAGRITAGFLPNARQSMPGRGMNVVDLPLILATEGGDTIVTDDGSSISLSSL